MLKRRVFVILLLVVVLTIKLHAQCDPAWDPGCQDEPATVPIPGILYFLAALVGIGAKKIYHARKKN